MNQAWDRRSLVPAKRPRQSLRWGNFEKDSLNGNTYGPCIPCRIAYLIELSVVSMQDNMS
jgi:hypothetical protein